MQFLDNKEINYRADEEKNQIVTGSKTLNYTDSNGYHVITIVVLLEEDGEYIKIFAPNCYHYPPDGPYRSEIFQACLMISWRTKSIQYEYDVSDGEIRCIIEFPLEDALLTEKQLMRCIYGIVTVTDKYDEMIRTAMNTGEIKLPDEESHDELMKAFREFLEQRKQEKRGSSGSTGIDLDE